MSSNLEDLQIISQYLFSGNPETFGRLISKYQSPIRRLFLQLLNNNSHQADDLSQETFIKAYQKIGSFQALSNFKTWLFSIAYRNFYDHCRKHNLHTTSSIEQTLEPLSHTVQQPHIEAHDKQQIHRAISTLSQIHQTVIILFYWDEFSISQISKILNTNPNTVKSHLGRAKIKLEKLLQNYTV